VPTNYAPFFLFFFRNWKCILLTDKCCNAWRNLRRRQWLWGRSTRSRDLLQQQWRRLFVLKAEVAV